MISSQKMPPSPRTMHWRMDPKAFTKFVWDCHTLRGPAYAPPRVTASLGCADGRSCGCSSSAEKQDSTYLECLLLSNVLTTVHPASNKAPTNSCRFEAALRRRHNTHSKMSCESPKALPKEEYLSLAHFPMLPMGPFLEIITSTALKTLHYFHMLQRPRLGSGRLPHSEIDLQVGCSDLRVPLLNDPRSSSRQIFATVVLVRVPNGVANCIQLIKFFSDICARRA